MGFWDDQDNKSPNSGGGGRLRFMDYGDRVKGRVTAMATFDGTNGKVPLVKLADVVARQAGVETQLPEGEFIAGATVLWAKLEEQRVDVGHMLDVTYTSETRSGQGFMVKQFEVKSQPPITVPTAISTPVPQATPVPPSDLFS
jgi:hypothetical protein